MPDPARFAELPTERQDDGAPEEPDVFVLTVVEGPDAGAMLTVDPASPSRVLLGKSVTATIMLQDREVSRRHASLRPEGAVLVLSDLGSTNGTFVNGVAVREATLRGGEAIRIGQTTIAVARGAPSFVTLTEERSFGRMLGASRAMRRLYPALHELAAGDRPVLIEGEAGAGKELCAEELHPHSARAGRPFVVLECHAHAAAELESRLFGEGGLLEQASGGTIYVDEIAALPGAAQRALVRALDRPLSARMLFGTRRDLDSDVADGRFNEALLARLAPNRIELPPLRDRDDDGELLARSFWRTLADAAIDGAPPESPELPADFLARFHRYRWPGNVRELSAAVSARFTTGALARWRATNLAPDERDPIGAVVDRELPLAEARKIVVDELERRYVDHMLSRHGNTRDAAVASGVGVRYFQLLRARLEL